jgi:putative membrane protein
MPKALIKIVVPAGAALALLSNAAWAQTPSDADRYAYGPHMMDPPGRTALDILKERFARGEIDKNEFEERRRVIGE